MSHGSGQGAAHNASVKKSGAKAKTPDSPVIEAAERKVAKLQAHLDGAIAALAALKQGAK